MYQPNNKSLVAVTKCLLLLLWLNSCNSITVSIGVSALQTLKTHIIRAENPQPLVLDCDYNVEESNSTLVIKWLKDEKPVYQWIKGHMPTVYPLSKGSIDEEYETSSNADYIYRAIKFPEPTKELSGIYKCLVETINNTEIIEIHLQVIDVSQSNILLHYITLQNDTILTCDVENVYPEPKLLLWSNDDTELSKISENVGPEINGYYNATVVVSVGAINPNDEIGCTAQFPGTEFNLTKILVSSTSTKKSTVVGVLIMLVLVVLA